MLPIQIALALLCHVTSTVYYVTPTIGKQMCSNDQGMSVIHHTLSYYINNIILPSNVFVKSENLLKSNEVLQIKSLNNVILLG